MDKKHRQIDDIETLRALAILLTIAVHLPDLFPWWYGPAGPKVYAILNLRVGVDLFFVISGFVIGSSVLDRWAHVGRSGFSREAVAFWIRRAWRIWPSSWLWLVFIVLASAFFNLSGAFGGPDSLRITLVEAAAGFLQVANVVIGMVVPLRPGEVATFYGNHSTWIYWSLSLEEQFYLLFPFVFLLSGRFLPHVLVGAVVGMFFVPKFEGLVSLMRFDPIALGVLLAIWRQHPLYARVEPTFLRKKPLLGGLLVLIVLGLASMALAQKVVFFANGLVTLACGVIVFVASFGKDYITPKLQPVRRVVLWIGSRSFALYLCHILLFQLTRELWYRLSPTGTQFDSTFTLRYAITGVALICAASELNYRLVERPMRNRGRRIADDYLLRRNADTARAA